MPVLFEYNYAPPLPAPASGGFAWSSGPNIGGGTGGGGGGGNPIISLHSSNAGTTIALVSDGLGNVIVNRSTNGGTSWVVGQTLAHSNSDPTLSYGNSVWIFSNDGSTVYRSTDDGLTWGTVSAASSTVTGAGIGTNGSGIWVLIPDLQGVYAYSGSNGSSWANSSAPPLNQAAYQIPSTGPIYWDGSQFVAVAQQHSGGAGTSFWTSSSGGTSWTQQTSNTNFLGQVALQSGNYVCINNINNGVRVAATVVGLAGASDTIISGLDSGGLYGCIAGHGYFVVTDGVGNAANSHDGGVTWKVSSLGMHRATDEAATAANIDYDSTHNVFIMGGQEGSISTFSPP